MATGALSVFLFLFFVFFFGIY